MYAVTFLTVRDVISESFLPATFSGEFHLDEIMYVSCVFPARLGGSGLYDPTELRASTF